MSESEAVRLAHQAASRAHVAKNALRADVGLTNLAAAVERLSQAVAMLAAEPSADDTVTTAESAALERDDEDNEEDDDEDDVEPESAAALAG